MIGAEKSGRGSRLLNRGFRVCDAQSRHDARHMCLFDNCSERAGAPTGIGPRDELGRVALPSGQLN